ncbi:MAG: malonyl-CoA synthase, partial [Pseudomonadota bacterium]
RADGFFITGDLGQMSPDGYLTIVGRGKDLVISGGFNVYPKEVEDAIDALPGVIENAVVGLPHPDLGEAVTAIVVGSSNEDTIRETLKQHLAAFKRPKRVLFVPELPRNAMGKVQKAAMRQSYVGLYTEP